MRVRPSCEYATGCLCVVTGSLIKELGKLGKLKVLRLKGNRLEGALLLVS
jgi:hypothetical protein